MYVCRGCSKYLQCFSKNGCVSYRGRTGLGPTCNLEISSVALPPDFKEKDHKYTPYSSHYVFVLVLVPVIVPVGYCSSLVVCNMALSYQMLCLLQNVVFTTHCHFLKNPYLSSGSDHLFIVRTTGKIDKQCSSEVSLERRHARGTWGGYLYEHADAKYCRVLRSLPLQRPRLITQVYF